MKRCDWVTCLLPALSVGHGATMTNALIAGSAARAFAQPTLVHESFVHGRHGKTRKGEPCSFNIDPIPPLGIILPQMNANQRKWVEIDSPLSAVPDLFAFICGNYSGTRYYAWVGYNYKILCFYRTETLENAVFSSYYPTLKIVSLCFIYKWGT